MIPVKCSICGQGNVKKILTCFNTHGRHVIDEKEKFFLYKCLNCSTLFPAKEIESDYYDKYYDNGYYDTKNENNNILGWIFGRIYKKKEKYILSYFKEKDNISILDIGCGTGEFLTSLKSGKFHKYGIEINKTGFHKCLDKGLEVFNQDISEIDFKDKKFDVITLWHVLEHLASPRNFFIKIKDILADDGIIIVQTPNSNSFGFIYGKENWFHLDSPRHLNIFDKKGVNCLCKLSGLKIARIKYEYYDYPLDLFWSLRKSHLRFLAYPLYPFFKFFSKEHLTYIINKKNE
jgi:2-polyprenyl-3-methyl-5-hydroxy-6-metoxy-1,4-benzoquinol methylase